VRAISPIRRTSSCVGKHAYTYQEAVAVRKRLHRQRDDKVQVYRCAACGYWHVGNASDGE